MTFGQIVLANPVCMVLVVSQSNCFCELGFYGAGCLSVKLFVLTRSAFCSVALFVLQLISAVDSRRPCEFGSLSLLIE